MESGVRMLLNDMKRALDRGVKIRILTGNYLGITQPSALYLIKSELGDRVDLRLYNETSRSFHPKSYGYARTLEEAMINKYFDMDVSKCYKKSDWKEKRKDSELKFSIPRMKNEKEIADDDMVSVRDILAATSGNKTDFMCSVIMKDYVKKMLPDYIERGLEWLMK